MSTKVPHAHPESQEVVYQASLQLYGVLMILRAKLHDGGSLDVGEIGALESIVGPVQHALGEITS
jgi:hypothetical protein